jgi:hypothetical protein
MNTTEKPMSVLKRKAEKNGSITIRVPLSAQQKLASLRPAADRAGFDLAGSLTDHVLAWLKQVEKELGNTEGLSGRRPRVTVNGSGEHA